MEDIRPVEDLGSTVSGSVQNLTMGGQVVSGIEALDTLDLTNVDTTRQIIKHDSLVDIRLKEAVVQASKDVSKNYQILKLTFETITQAEGNDVGDDGTRKPVKPGFEMVEYIPLKPATDDYNYAERLAVLQLCFLGVKGKWNTAALKAATGRVRVMVEVDKAGQYPPKNKVKSFLPKKVEHVSQVA